MKKDVYIFKSGELKKENDSLVLITKTGKDYIPIHQIDNIHIFGEISINKKLIQFLSKNDKVILYYSYYGNFIGSFIPNKYKTGKILIEQVSSYVDTKRRNEIAKLFVEGNIYNEISLLKYYRKKKVNLNSYISQIEDLLKSINDINIEDKKYIDTLLLIEARAKNIYYSCFDIILKNSEYKFEKRSKHPPMNEVNAMLSYGYAIMYSESLSAITRSRLVSEISFVHSCNKDGAKLQLDLADMLKPVIVDRLVLRLIRRKVVKPEYFEEIDGGIYLSKEGKTFFTENLNEILNKTVYDGRSRRYYTYKKLFHRDVYLLINHILNKHKYKYFRMGW